jgi:hypothetical protein
MMEQEFRRPAPTSVAPPGAPTRPAAAPGAHAAPPRAAALDAMVDALRSESRLLEELTTIMGRQRTAVGADDLEGLDDAVFATHRVLVTLAEARRRRRSVNRLLGAPEELSAHQLEHLLGEAMSPPLADARDRLHAAAAALAREVDVNRRVLADAMASSDSYVRTLYGAPAGREGAGWPAAEPAAGGRLLNRTA